MSRDISERLRAAEALRESERQVRDRLAEIETIYDAAPIGLCALDTDLRFVRLNRRFAEINGVSVEEHLGRTPNEVVPDLGNQAEAAMRTVLETGQPLISLEVSGVTPAQPGVVRYWNEGWAPLRDGTGTITGISIAAIETTEQRRTEQALRERDERQVFLLALGDRLRELDDVAAIAADASALVGRHLGANGVVYCEIDPSETLSTVRADWNDGTVPSSVGSYCMDDFGIGELYRRGEVRRTTDVTTAYDRDEAGEHSALRIRASLGVPVMHSGKLVAVLAVHSAQPRDWTDAEVELVREAGDRIWSAVERARSETALAESEERLRLAQEGATIGVWDWDLRTGRQSYSAEIARLYGVEGAALENVDLWRRCVHPDDLARVEAVRDAALEAQAPFRVEYRVVRPSGEVRWLAGTGRGTSMTGEPSSG